MPTTASGNRNCSHRAFIAAPRRFRGWEHAAAENANKAALQTRFGLRRSPARASWGAAAMRTLVAVLALIALLAPPPAAAQRGDELDALFAQSLADPANLDLALRYARLAAELGDLEAAVTALERVLFYDPEAVEARIDLGVLYERLGSFGLAREQFERVSGRVSPERQAEIDRYLRALERRERQHVIGGYVVAGLRHQSNATLSASSVVRSLGTDVALTGAFAKQEDQSIVTFGSLGYAYDLRDQDRTTLELGLQEYSANFFRVKEFDLLYLEATFGPRTSLRSWGLEGFGIKPFGIVDFVTLGGDRFYHAFGGGLELSQALTPDLALKLVYEARSKDYHPTAERPQNDDFSGLEGVAYLQLAYASGDHLLYGTFAFTDQDTRAAAQTNRQYDFALGYQLSYDLPFALGSAQWGAELHRTLYDFAEPDPAVDPAIARFDRLWRLSLTQTLQFTETLGFYVLLERTVVSSSLPNFAYNDTSILIGPLLRF
jgi:hypothetical protein